MPLKPGASIKDTVTELMTNKPGPARRKAIATYAENHGISKKDAQFGLSLVIARENYKRGSKH